MADIQALCERVIIDHGKTFFDGKLSEIVDRFADFKLVTIQSEKANEYPAEIWRVMAKFWKKPPRRSSSRSSATASSRFARRCSTICP